MVAEAKMRSRFCIYRCVVSPSWSLIFNSYHSMLAAEFGLHRFIRY